MYGNKFIVGLSSDFWQKLLSVVVTFNGNERYILFSLRKILFQINICIYTIQVGFRIKLMNE